MNQAEITELTRRGIREPRPLKYSDTDIENITLEGVSVVGMKIKENDPSYYNARKSLSSNTHVFSKPSDCLTILRIWDMKTNAATITGAADNGSGGIRITSASHGFDDDDIVLVHDVGGTTEADGTWKVENSATNTFDLVGSTFSNTYTSGGKVYEDVTYPYKIEKKNLREATLDDERGWYPREDKIVVDDKDFTYDIIIDYEKAPSAITDIPAEYHMALVAFNVINLLVVPRQDDPSFHDLAASHAFYTQLFKLIESRIDESFRVSSEPEDIAEGINFEDFL